jgi:hypothetical protein
MVHVKVATFVVNQFVKRGTGFGYRGAAAPALISLSMSMLERHSVHHGQFRPGGGLEAGQLEKVA